MRRILFEILRGNYHSVLIHRDVVRRDTVNLLPALSTGIFKCQFNVFERLMNVFVEVFGKRSVLSPVALDWRKSSVPSTLA